MRWAVRIALAAEFHAEPFAALCLVAGGTAAAGPWRTGWPFCARSGGSTRGRIPPGPWT